MWYLIRHLRRRRLLEEKRRRESSRFRDIKSAEFASSTSLGGPTRTNHSANSWWHLGIPFVACAVLAIAWSGPLGWLAVTLVMIALISAVLVAVHHAEIVALRVGEPFGTLILALAVTVIEVALIASLMLSGGADTSSLARDTVFATVMIVCNGGIGLSLLVGTLRHFVLEFRVEGTSPALSVIIALTTLTLILPTLTTTTPGPTFSPAQLTFAGVASLVLYGVFVFVQTVRHRDYFLPIGEAGDRQHAAPPSTQASLISLLLLCVSLIAVVGLAKSIAPNIQNATAAISAPAALVGVAIALLVILPETWAAMRAALRNRMQTSLNLLLGSALATIGLTIPSVAALSLFFNMPLQLGLPPKDMALLILTFLVSITTLASGRATVLHGVVHLVLFATFLFLVIVP